MKRSALVLPALVVLAAALTACARKQQPAAAPVPTPVSAAPHRDSFDPAPQPVDDGALAREAALRASEARAVMTAPVYFDFDRSELSEAGRSRLDAKLPIMQADASMRIRIMGNTDERGSDEYNLALGHRRALVAKRYLVEHGIDAARITTVSFGEEHPAVDGHDEAAYAQNRRDEFEFVVANSVAARGGR
jgi:peptidoglycan-associated lipoprotein